MTPLSDKLVSPPAIADLLVEHRAKVDEILALLPIQGDEDVIIDALFALRFLLSSRSRDVAEATKNAKATLEWRRANRAKLAAAAQGDFPCAETFRSFVKSAYALLQSMCTTHKLTLVRRRYVKLRRRAWRLPSNFYHSRRRRGHARSAQGVDGRAASRVPAHAERTKL